MAASIRPGRPFGVSLAIALCTLIFSIVPLVEVGFLLVVNQTIYQDETGVIFGTDVLQSASFPIFMQTFISLAFLLIAIFAWRGGRAHIRRVFVVVTLGFAAILIAFQILPAIFAQPNLEQGLDSLTDTFRQWRVVQLIVMVLIAWYVAWYMNRWAARAFYRGYYTEDDLERLKQMGVDVQQLQTEAKTTQLD